MNAVSDPKLNRINWQTVVMFALGFWLSSSLLIDFLIIPGLSAAGMMTQEGFASAGYLIFGIFNRIELLCAALILTGFLVIRRNHLIPIEPPVTKSEGFSLLNLLTRHYQSYVPARTIPRAF